MREGGSACDEWLAIYEAHAGSRPGRLRLVRTVLGSIGGRPEWVQSPEIPSCPECERAMFFVGQIETLWLDVSFVELLGFVCEHCAITVQVRQNS